MGSNRAHTCISYKNFENGTMNIVTACNNILYIRLAVSLVSNVELVRLSVVAWILLFRKASQSKTGSFAFREL